MKTTRLESKDCTKETGFYEETKGGAIEERKPMRKFTGRQGNPHTLKAILPCRFFPWGDLETRLLIRFC